MKLRLEEAFSLGTNVVHPTSGVLPRLHLNNKASIHEPLYGRVKSCRSHGNRFRGKRSDVLHDPITMLVALSQSEEDKKGRRREGQEFGMRIDRR
jgi:hypothetical protein